MIHPNILVAIVVAHIFTGIASVANRYLVNYLDATEVAFLRYVFGAIFVLFIFLFQKPEKAQRPYIFNSILLGILFFGLFPYLFAESFKLVSAAEGALILATMPIWAMIIGHLSGRETIKLHLFISIILTVLGLFIALSDKLLGTGFDMGDLRGEITMIIAAIIGAIYSIQARTVFENVPASRHTLIGMVAGFIALMPFAIHDNMLNDLTQIDLRLWVIIILFGCFTGGLAFYLFNWVIKRTTATFATLFVPLNPLVAMILGWLLLNESLSMMFIVGAFLVITGLFIASMRPLH